MMKLNRTNLSNKNTRIISISLAILIITTYLLLSWVQIVHAAPDDPPAPTVTSTPTGPMIKVSAYDQDQINVRSGPGVTYPLVGVLLFGQEMPALGRTAGGDWILIAYPGVQDGQGWVYSSLVSVYGGELPIIEPPPTPTPQFTPTIDPTLAAQFWYTQAPTRLPTYTPAPPVVIPEFEDKAPVGVFDIGIPMGLIIFVLGLLGLVLGLVILTQRR
jgi:hypothetical protein